MIMKICVVYKETFQWQKPSYTHIIRIKRTRELLYMNIIKPISPIDYNEVRFIVYNVDDAFRVHFGECIKEKKEASRVFHI